MLLWRNLHGGFENHNNADTYVWFANKDTGNILNFSGFDNETTQSLLEQGRGETDPAAIKKTYQDFNKAMAEGLYSLPVWYVNWAIGYQPDVKLDLPAAARRGREAALPLRADPGARPVQGLTPSAHSSALLARPGAPTRRGGRRGTPGARQESTRRATHWTLVIRNRGRGGKDPPCPRPRRRARNRRPRRLHPTA